MPISHETLVQALQSALEPLDYVHAMWEGGSAAFGRADAYSDLDLQLDCDDARIADAFAVVDATLTELSPITLQYRVPEPAWHGMSQRFYQLRDAGPFLLIDLALRRASDRDRFNEVELHGTPIVYFDKLGVVQTKPLDAAAHRARLRARLAELQVLVPMFRGFVSKELMRDNALGALHYYHAFVWRPLHEAAMMLHCPARYNFSPHYAAFELPPALLTQLRDLYYVGAMTELAAKADSAAELFTALCAELNQQYSTEPAPAG